MSFDNALAFLKSRKIPTEWLEPVKRGFKCYYCGNGSSDKGTGATLSSDGTRLLCGKCGKAFSYIDIAAFHYNLDISTFSDTVKKICEYEGISLNNHSIQTDETSTLLNHNSQNTKSISIELQNLIVDDVENAKKNLAKLPENEKRGLNDQTLKLFHIGVNFSWTPPSSRLSNEHKKAYSSPRVIIPHLTNPSLPAFHLTYYASLFLSERERLSNASKSPVKGLYGGGRTPFGLNTLKTIQALFSSLKANLTHSQFGKLPTVNFLVLLPAALLIMGLSMLLILSFLILSPLSFSPPIMTTLEKNLRTSFVLTLALSDFQPFLFTLIISILQKLMPTKS